jgi:hypothetical protein
MSHAATLVIKSRVVEGNGSWRLALEPSVKTGQDDESTEDVMMC